MIIEIGGSTNPRYRPNLDIRPGPTVDIVADLNKPLPLTNDSYEHVYSAYADTLVTVGGVVDLGERGK